MVAQGFGDLCIEMQQGFAHLGNEIEDVRTQLQEHGLRLNRIERKLDNTIEQVDDHSVHLERLEKRHDI